MSNNLAIVQLGKSAARELIESIKVNVQRGHDAVRKARADLIRLDEGKGWAALNYSSLVDCIQQEMGWKKPQAYAILRAARVEAKLDSENQNIGEMPTSHLLAVADLPINEAKKVMRKVNKEPRPTRQRVEQLAAEAQKMIAAREARAVDKLAGMSAEQKLAHIQKKQDDLKHEVKMKRKREGIQQMQQRALKLTAKHRKLHAGIADLSDFDLPTNNKRLDLLAARRDELVAVMEKICDELDAEYKRKRVA